MTQSLHGAGHPLAVLENQHPYLRPSGAFRPFDAAVGGAGLSAGRLQILQINVGKMCNQTCKHCHVDAGPDRTEVMTRPTMQACLDLLAATDIPVVDITGGAPEMNPDFCWLVTQIRALGRRVIDRCNLTILTVPRYHDLPQFLADHEVEVVSSLPYYSADATDRQRGEGVFERSIAALRTLNGLGYGMPGSKRALHLVYNPVGAFLPPAQAETEQTFKQQLHDRFGVRFHQLYVITNQPINRFLEFLLRTNNYEDYMQRLLDAYNPGAVEGLMCRSTLSVGWDGRLYDCDFNQMLELDIDPTVGPSIFDFQPDQWSARRIVTGLHCYACTAGQGSSCTGATAPTG